MIGRLVSLAPTFEKGKQLITLEINGDFREAYDALREKPVKVEIKRFHPRRSLNANAYAWVLINRIADAAGATEDEIYLACLRDYGQSQMVSVKPDIDVSGYFKYYTDEGASTINGAPCVWYRVYKGSSEFDTKEMAAFIDGIVSEAKALGIPTETPAEIERMKERW